MFRFETLHHSIFPAEIFFADALYKEVVDLFGDILLMAHARREFVEALEVIPKDFREGSLEMEFVALFDKLFAFEESFSLMTPEERKAKRLEFSKPVLDQLYEKALHANVEPKRQIGKAVQYLIGQRKWLTAWLEDGRLEISNNRAERSMKPFVTGRKNFLFCNWST